MCRRKPMPHSLSRVHEMTKFVVYNGKSSLSAFFLNPSTCSIHRTTDVERAHSRQQEHSPIFAMQWPGNDFIHPHACTSGDALARTDEGKLYALAGAQRPKSSLRRSRNALSKKCSVQTARTKEQKKQPFLCNGGNSGPSQSSAASVYRAQQRSIPMQRGELRAQPEFSR